jgi:kynurenine 3-monooxygenase
MIDTTSIAVIGGGPAGACMALILAQRGFSVDVYEKREDPRAAERAARLESAALGQAADAAKRSINLALSVRGQSALAAVGVLDAVMARAVPMPARAIHDAAGRVVTQAYGQPGQAIFSVSRAHVNAALLDACEAFAGGAGRVRLHFSAALESLGAGGELAVRVGAGAAAATTATRPALIVGADGAFSAVRAALLRHARVDFARRFIRHAYKELALPAADG